MSAESEEDHLNPLYGSGIFRRRIRLRASGSEVRAELEDSAHGFRALLQHDGKVVTDIQGETLRAPYNICPSANQPLKNFIGQQLDLSLRELNERVNARSNCTHLYDLSALALEFAHWSSSNGDGERQIDITIPDETELPTDATAHIDGVEILRWQIHQWQIKGPAEIVGKPMHKGFSAWANELYSGLQNTAAFALQKGYLVAESRRYDMDALAGNDATENLMMAGLCHTFSPDNIDKAERLSGTMRDFSDAEEQLLQFK